MEGDDEKAKLQQYLDKIPSLTRLDCSIESEEELCHISDKLTDWESKYYLLKLTYYEISDIKSQYTHPALQRREAMQKWKDRTGVDSTYKNFLKICVRGEWHDSAMVIVNLLKEYGGLTIGESQAAAMAKEVDLVVPSSSMFSCDDTSNSTELNLLLWNMEIRTMALLHLIKYSHSDKGPVKELRILQELAPDWDKIGEMLHFNPSEIAAIQNAGASKTLDQCIRDVFSRWMQNPLKKYPNNWKGIYQLLVDSKHGIAAEDLKAAIAAPYSDFKHSIEKARGPKVSVQSHRVPSQQAEPATQGAAAQSEGDRSKMNKRQLASWLEKNGIDDEDIQNLKDQGVNENLFLRLKDGDKYTKDLSPATIDQIPILQEKLKAL